MLNIPAVRLAMATQIGNLAYPPLRSLPEPEDQINAPIGIVMPGRPYGTYGVTLQGDTGFLGAPSLGQTLSPTLVNLDYLIVVAKASTLERVSSDIDLWIGFESDGTSVSVPAAIASDPTLGGTVEWCVPTTVDPPGPLEWSGPAMFGTRIHFQLSVA